MESNPQQERQQAHALLDHLSDTQVAAVRGLLETMLDPVARALANAPVDDEPVTEEEERAVAEAREWLKQNPGIPFEQVVAELGLTLTHALCSRRSFLVHGPRGMGKTRLLEEALSIARQPYVRIERPAVLHRLLIELAERLSCPSGRFENVRNATSVALKPSVLEALRRQPRWVPQPLHGELRHL